MVVGDGRGVHGGRWGAAPYWKNPKLPMAQVVAGLLMFGPLFTAFWTPWKYNCSGIGTSYTQLSFAGTVPFSVINHFGHAAAGRWVPVLQKLDRSFIALSCTFGCYGMSQDLAFTMGSVILALVTVSLMWLGSPRFRDSESLATGLVALCILYGLVPMILYRDSIDPNLVPAASAILAGFALFQCDPLGVWTDSAWHLLLVPYVYFCQLSAISLDQRSGICVSP